MTTIDEEVTTWTTANRERIEAGPVAAILARFLVALEQVAAVKGDFAERHAVVTSERHDFGHAEAVRDGLDEQFAVLGGHSRPIRPIVSLKISRIDDAGVIVPDED